MHTHDTLYLLIWTAKMTKFILLKKINNAYAEDYMQTICTFSDHDLNTCKVLSNRSKTVGGVPFTRYLISINFGRKND